MDDLRATHTEASSDLGSANEVIDIDLPAHTRHGSWGQ
jgi:hypothetical protein